MQQYQCRHSQCVGEGTLMLVHLQRKKLGKKSARCVVITISAFIFFFSGLQFLVKLPGTNGPGRFTRNVKEWRHLSIYLFCDASKAAPYAASAADDLTTGTPSICCLMSLQTWLAAPPPAVYTCITTSSADICVGPHWHSILEYLEHLYVVGEKRIMLGGNASAN